MNEPRRAYAGPTEGEYQCAGCGRWSKLERAVDERTVEREQVEGGVLISEHPTSRDLNPPPLAATYRCPRCGHVHGTLPATG